MTCRTHFFRTIRDQHTFFRAQDRDGVGPDLYEALHLLPFDDAQIRAYLERKQGAAGVDKAIDLIRSVHDLEGLATRPFNLRLISEHLERLERRVAEGRSIDAAALYDELVQSWLERDMGKHQLERDHKVRLMEDLAALLWSREARRIDVAELEAWLRRRLLGDDDLHAWVQLVHPDPVVLAEDLRTATFIVRPGADQFEFAHTSLLEYFLARYLHRTMRDGDLDAWALPRVSDETLDFLVEIEAAQGSDAFRRHLLECGEAYRPRISEHAVRYALRSVERGGQPVSLRGFQLGTADLRGIRVEARSDVEVDMAGCVLEGADLRDARLRRVCLDGADLRDARLTRAELHRCSLRAADLSGASLEGAIVRASNVDGARLLGATGDDSQWLWNEGEPAGGGPSGRLVAPSPATPLGPPARLEVLAGASGTVTSLAWAPDGTRLAAGHAAGIDVWSPVSGAQHASLAHREVQALAWSPDGGCLASAGLHGVVRLWHPAQPDAAPLALEGHTGRVQALAWSPDGGCLASAGQARVRLSDPAQPDAAPLALEGHTGRVQALAWSPDGGCLASAGNDGVVRLWDSAQPGAAPLALKGHTGWVWALAWSPDDGCLASAGHDGVVRLWDPPNPAPPPWS